MWGTLCRRSGGCHEKWRVYPNPRWGVSRTESKEVEGVMREKQDVWVIEGSFSFSGRKSGRRSQVSKNCVIMKNMKTICIVSHIKIYKKNCLAVCYRLCKIWGHGWRYNWSKKAENEFCKKMVSNSILIGQISGKCVLLSSLLSSSTRCPSWQNV
jgi:hypothetical protein